LNRALITVGILIYASASAEVIIDSIGPMDGSGVGDTVTSNQYFEPKYASFDIALLENISVQSPTVIGTIEIVLDGWDAFIDPSSITAYQANIYSDSEEAALSLVGDVATQIIDVADVSLSAEWYGNGFLLAVPTQLSIDTGTYWYSVIPTNEFETFGQVGLAETSLGDGINSMQANPGEGFGFGPLRELGYEIAFRVHDNVIVDPCSLPLLNVCSEDINGDGFVTVLDLLEIIGQWGMCGDGTFRPAGDCAPQPNGDCCVSISDILAVVAAWEFECTPHGSCCLPTGVCKDDVTQQFCILDDGVFFGNYTLCAEQECFAGACCIDLSQCIESSQFECNANLGIFHGNETQCIDIDCSILAPGDECDDSIEVSVGFTPFSTLLMTPSQPQPDETSCDASNLVWANSPDIWLSFTAPSSEAYRFSLCDDEGYDTSMVLYEENCDNQILCNGDAADQDDACQPFYSEFEHILTQDETYFIRIGGWYGDIGTGTLAISLVPPAVPGACCFPDGSCLEEAMPHDCNAFGGTFEGGGVDCITADCIIVEGDECEEAVEVFLGSRSFTTEYASPSEPEPAEFYCPDTYLEWDNSPDIWVKWIAPDDGVATFTTCDPDSFDTSIVLYEETCSTQVACNGDATPDNSCQSYYSSIDYDVTVGTTYFIRIGGWQGTTGSGTVTIFLDGENDIAPCCYNGTCYEDQSEQQCADLGGSWYLGETCKTANCSGIPCHSSLITQSPHSPSDSWYAGKSSYDGSSSEYTRAEFVNVPAIEMVTVWGLQAYFDGSTWTGCDADFLFTVRSYEDNQGLPGPIVDESYQTPAKRTATGILYAGVYELMRWDIPFQTMNVEHISVQSESADLSCWFLWLSSGSGDSLSGVNDGSGWLYEYYDLSICIE